MSNLLNYEIKRNLQKREFSDRICFFIFIFLKWFNWQETIVHVSWWEQFKMIPFQINQNFTKFNWLFVVVHTFQSLFKSSLSLSPSLFHLDLLFCGFRYKFFLLFLFLIIDSSIYAHYVFRAFDVNCNGAISFRVSSCGHFTWFIFVHGVGLCMCSLFFHIVCRLVIPSIIIKNNNNNLECECLTVRNGTLQK